ncbi:ABC transporter ATP-binding protein [Faecalicatena contorta]|uniref:ABC-2 type transport system ATP-binding protein n=1 Tax=Faecalicatena contorta TaxID=39482 RepID=A0A315ZXV1_9FIRM|nr:ABC transporter ATP-binding protein [Faecalicatena contorta]PWJ49730.1 ABC-2 type transport system ATP-binding protein [Faecalicatena contorta]SUQ14448.1 ABC-2 type transport system ATP-binding protein [Faecalicatena contorta]
MNQAPVVQLQHATKRIGNRNIVNDLSFDIPAGEVFGFLGPNGAGKTTTIRMMVGLIKISQGDVVINGHSITKDFNKAIRNVGAIVENPDLYKHLTGYQNLKHYARMIPGVSKTRINEMVEIVGLKEKIHNKVRTYSLGMRQRLGIAQALLHRPPLLILDEPTNGLDPAGIHELRNYLKRLAHEEGVSVFVSSHLLSEMELMCDRVGVLQNGELVSIQNIQDFVHKGGASRICVTVEPAQMEQAKWLIANANKTALPTEHPGQLFIQMDKEEIPKINKLLMDAGIQVYSIQMKEQTLEDKFLEITEEKKCVD